MGIYVIMIRASLSPKTCKKNSRKGKFQHLWVSYFSNAQKRMKVARRAHALSLNDASSSGIQNLYGLKTTTTCVITYESPKNLTVHCNGCLLLSVLLGFHNRSCLWPRNAANACVRRSRLIYQLTKNSFMDPLKGCFAVFYYCIHCGISGFYFRLVSIFFPQI